MLDGALDGMDQAGRHVCFRHVAVGANSAGLRPEVSGGVLSEEDDAGVGSGVKNFLHCADPVDVWHLNIEEHDIRQQFGSPSDGFTPVRRFTNDLEIGDQSEQLTNAATHHFAVIRNQYPRHVAPQTGDWMQKRRSR